MDDPLVPAAPELDSGAAEPEDGGSQADPQKGADQAQALLRKLRKAEKERDALLAAQKSAADSQLSEAEQLKAKLIQAEADRDAVSAKLTQRTLQHRFEAAAQKLGVVDADAAYKLADLSAVEIDEDGNVTGIDAALADLKKTRKYLFGAPNGAIGSAGGNPPSGSPGQLTAAKLRSMDPTGPEFRQAMADIAAGRIK